MLPRFTLMPELQNSISVYHVYACLCVGMAHRGQKGVLDPLELELQAVVRGHVGAVGNGAQVLCRRSKPS